MEVISIKTTFKAITDLLHNRHHSGLVWRDEKARYGKVLKAQHEKQESIWEPIDQELIKESQKDEVMDRELGR